MKTTAGGNFTVSAGAVSGLTQTNDKGAYLAGVGYSGDSLTWTQAPESGDTLTVTIQEYYTGAITTLTPTSSDGLHWTASLAGLGLVSPAYYSTYYFYFIKYTHAGAATPYLETSGTLQVNAQVGLGTVLLNNDAVSPGQITGFQDAGGNLGYLGWTTAATSIGDVLFRYRAAGAATWAGTLTPVAWGTGYYVDLASTGLSGAIEYEVTYTHAGASTPYMAANGSVTLSGSGAVTGSNLQDTTSSAPEIQPQALTTRLHQTFDRWGNVASYTDAVSQTTNYRYNERNQVAEVKAPTVQVVSTRNNITVDAFDARPTSRNVYDIWGRLVATLDANGNRNRIAYNEANQVASETLAENTAFTNTVSGTKAYRYNAFGDRVQVTDELGYRTRNFYDANGQLVKTAQELELGVNGGFNSADPYSVTATAASNVILHAYAYDQAGRRISETSGELMDDGVTPETTKYKYDLRGNLVMRRTPLGNGHETNYEYDPYGNGKKTKETDAIGGVMTWTYDAFGRLRGHTDIVGETGANGTDPTTTTEYIIDQGGFVTDVNSTVAAGAQSQLLTKHYVYDADGHLASITESGQAIGSLVGITRETKYSYDAMGRVVREKVKVDGVVHQDTITTYDAMGRIAHLSDPRYKLTYQYDAASNRTHIKGDYFDQTGAAKTSDLWYSYDGANRVAISQGVKDVAGTVAIDNTQGIALTYTARGERATAKQFGKLLAHMEAERWNSTHTDTYAIDTWSESDGDDTQRYSYDGAGRLKGVDRLYAWTVEGLSGSSSTTYDWTRTDTRTYDGASRQLSEARVTADTTTKLLTTRDTTSTYDDDGRLRTQANLKGGILESAVSFGFGDSIYTGTSTYISAVGMGGWGFSFGGFSYTSADGWTLGYDRAGTLHGYTVIVYDASGNVAYTQYYSMTHRSGDAYQETSQKVANVSGSTAAPLSGFTERQYNLNGELVKYTDSQDNNKNRHFANNSSGQALNVLQGNYADPTTALSYALLTVGMANDYKLQSLLVAGGQQVGSLQSTGISGVFKANFDVNYTPVSDDFPGSVPAQVVVQANDTLRTIAAQVYGDANLWYIIAEENGLTDPNAALDAGRVLRIPNSVTSLSNTAGTFKPYDVRAAIGDTTPTQPMPPPPSQHGGGCGVIGMIIVIIVVIIVTIYTAGAAAGAMGAVGAGGATGTAAVGTATLAGTATVAGGAAFGTGAMIGAAAIGGAVGAAAGQLAAMAMGMQDKFDWKGVALGAIGSGVGAGLGAAAKGLELVEHLGQYGAAAASAAAGSVLTQGIAVATGLQEKFSWRQVAASAIAAPIAQAVGKGVGGLTKDWNPDVSKFTVDFASGMAGGLTQAVVRGGKVDVVNIAADAFGNAIGNSIVDKATPQTTSAGRGNGSSSGGWDDELQEVQVTAKKIDVNPDDTIRSGSNLSGDELREIQITAQRRGADGGSVIADELQEVQVTETKRPAPGENALNSVADQASQTVDAYSLDSFVDDPNRVMVNNGLRNERGQYARNPLKQSAAGGKEPTLGAKSALDLFAFGDPPEQTSIPLVGDGDYLNLTNTREFSGAGEFGKDGFSLDFTGKSTTEIRYGDSLRLPSAIPELLGQVDARSVLDVSLTATTQIGPGGVELGAGFRAEAVAVQVPFQVKLEREYEFLKLGVEVSGAGNLGGVGGVADAGGALSTRGVRGYLEAGVTPLIGARVRVSASIEFKPQIVSYVSNPAHNPLAPLGAWIGQKLYDIGH